MGTVAVLGGCGLLLTGLCSPTTAQPEELQPRRLPHFAREIPQGAHWAQDLDAGQRRLRDGVVEVRLPFTEAHPELLSRSPGILKPGIRLRSHPGPRQGKTPRAGGIVVLRAPSSFQIRVERARRDISAIVLVPDPRAV